MDDGVKWDLQHQTLFCIPFCVVCRPVADVTQLVSVISQSTNARLVQPIPTYLEYQYPSAEHTDC